MGVSGEQRVSCNVNTKITPFSAKKRQGIVKAAHDLFLDQGYELTSMDDIAVRARVSKPTVYNHFRDKEALFAEVVRTTTDDVEQLVSLVTRNLTDPEDFDSKLVELAREFLAALMQPQMLKLRRMVIANAERFPDVARLWYEQGFERVLRTLADCFQTLVERSALRVDDPMMAAQHFVGLLLWIPINKAMFTGDHQSSRAMNDRYASAAVETFVAAYSKRRKIK